MNMMMMMMIIIIINNIIIIITIIIIIIIIIIVSCWRLRGFAVSDADGEHDLRLGAAPPNRFRRSLHLLRISSESSSI